MVNNKFKSNKHFETHALAKVIGREFTLENPFDDGEVGKIAEQKLFGKTISSGKVDFYVNGKPEELKVYKSESIHILTSKSGYKIKQKAVDKMKRSSLIYYEKAKDIVKFDTLFRLNKMNEKIFKKLLNIRQNKNGEYEVNITLSRIEQSYNNIRQVAA